MFPGRVTKSIVARVDLPIVASSIDPPTHVLVSF
jgi:hypothetical protein